MYCNPSIHSRDLRNKQKHRDAKNPAPARKPAALPQQPLPGELLEEVDNLVAGDNFNDLVSQTASGGGRFVLRTEKDWNKDIALGSGSDQFAHHFNLDVQQLAQAIATIPFHERFDLGDVTITDGIRDQFNRDAATHKKNHRKQDQVDTRIGEERPLMPLRIIAQPPVEHVVHEPKEDIQGWLDDVLDL